MPTEGNLSRLSESFLNVKGRLLLFFMSFQRRQNPMIKVQSFTLLLLFLSIGSCTSLKPITPVDYVDLERFMGDWYVIANIPTFLEKNAYNPIESYEINPDGTIATTFSFNAGSYDGEQKIYHPKGFVTDGSGNAVWGMQFVWPIKADYRVVYLNEDYDQVIIGRNRRDYAWIMARTPQISEEDYDKMVGLVESFGYQIDRLQKAQHR